MMLKTYSSCITFTPAVDLVEVRAQSAVEEAEELESVERTMRISNLTEGYGLVEASTIVSGVH
jgi:hypothetical protein